jgi:hypothetical protein
VRENVPSVIVLVPDFVEIVNTTGGLDTTPEKVSGVFVGQFEVALLG